MEFGPLFTLSYYSSGLSVLSIDDIIDIAKENNFKYIALTDRNHMHGILEFYTKCKQNNIIPIIGMWIDLPKYNLNIVALATTNDEYEKLCVCSTYINNSKTPPTLNEILPLIAQLKLLSPSFVKWETQQKFIKNHNLKIYLNNVPCLFVKQKNSNTHKICNILWDMYPNISNNLQNWNNINDLNIISQFNENNISKIKKFIGTNNILLTSKTKLPCILNADDKLNEKCLKKLHLLSKTKNFINTKIKQKYFDRYYHEYKTIQTANFSSYLLIVADYVNFAKQQNILVGPARGSAAGSLIVFLLGITEIDPLEHNLLFERFLNLERKSFPDIDIDVEDIHRKKVFDYIFHRYPNFHVAHIGAYSRLQFKAAIKDVARAMKTSQYTPNFVNNLTKKFNYFSPISEQFKNPIIKKIYQDHQELLDMGLKFDNFPRHQTIHAAGIVISDKPLSLVCPLTILSDGLVVTQYDMYYLESIGLLKMDILGIRNLTTIKNTINRINSKINNTNFTYSSLPYDDKLTYNLINSRNTLGVFQLDTPAAISALIKMKIRNFNDLVALISLNRPGPSKFIELYNNRSQHKVLFEIIPKEITPILKSTYGIIIFQEQIIQIIQTISDISAGEADLFRVAISKKDSNLMQKMLNVIYKRKYPVFSNDIVIQIIDKISKFANYGFNRSHAVGYATITFFMAYLKANYPIDFIISLIENNQLSNPKMGLWLIYYLTKILPKFNLNHVENTIFYKQNKVIYLPLIQINNCGEVAIKNIQSEKVKNGEFTSLSDIFNRLGNKLSISVWKSLISAGCFDCYNPNREGILSICEQIIDIKRKNLDIDIKNILNKINGSFEMSPELFKKLSKHENTALGYNLQYNSFIHFLITTKCFCCSDLLVNLPLSKLKNHKIAFFVKRIIVWKTFFCEISDLVQTISLQLEIIDKKPTGINQFILKNKFVSATVVNYTYRKIILKDVKLISYE